MNFVLHWNCEKCFFFFFYNTDIIQMLSKQGNRISGNGKWNFLMEYIFQEEKGNEEILDNLKKKS